jgi:hypothetical protein
VEQGDVERLGRLAPCGFGQDAGVVDKDVEHGVLLLDLVGCGAHGGSGVHV